MPLSLVLSYAVLAQFAWIIPYLILASHTRRELVTAGVRKSIKIRTGSEWETARRNLSA